jgi:hypothetical protein
MSSRQPVAVTIVAAVPAAAATAAFIAITIGTRISDTLQPQALPFAEGQAKLVGYHSWNRQESR